MLAFGHRRMLAHSRHAFVNSPLRKTSSCFDAILQRTPATAHVSLIHRWFSSSLQHFSSLVAIVSVYKSFLFILRAFSLNALTAWLSELSRATSAHKLVYFVCTNNASCTKAFPSQSYTSFAVRASSISERNALAPLQAHTDARSIIYVTCQSFLARPCTHFFVPLRATVKEKTHDGTNQRSHIAPRWHNYKPQPPCHKPSLFCLHILWSNLLIICLCEQDRNSS